MHHIIDEKKMPLHWRLKSHCHCRSTMFCLRRRCYRYMAAKHGPFLRVRRVVSWQPAAQDEMPKKRYHSTTNSMFIATSSGSLAITSNRIGISVCLCFFTSLMVHFQISYRFNHADPLYTYHVKTDHFISHVSEENQSHLSEENQIKSLRTMCFSTSIALYRVRQPPYVFFQFAWSADGAHRLSTFVSAMPPNR